MLRRALVMLLPAALLWGAAPAARGEGWPEGLAAAAEEHRQTLNRKQAATRDGTLASPVGVEESVQFDLQNHACHRGPAQAYREYGEPDRAPAEPGRSGRVAVLGGEERARVRYPYRVWFRQALTLEEMFAKPWREGNDGSIEVEFRRSGKGWIAFGKKELLGRGEEKQEPKRSGEGSERGVGQRSPREGGGR